MLYEADIQNPTIFINEFEIREPITSLTDLLVAAVAFWGVWYLTKNKYRSSKQFQYYRYYFICFALGMTAAGLLGHAFQGYLTVAWKMVGWLFSLTAQLFLVQASLGHNQPFIPSHRLKLIRTLSIATYLTFVLLTLLPQTRDFKLVQIGNAIILIGFTLPLQVFFFSKHKNKGAQYVLISILFGIVTGILYNAKLSVNQWFNYHDIGHCMVSINMVIMIMAAQHLALLKNSSATALTE